MGIADQGIQTDRQHASQEEHVLREFAALLAESLATEDVLATAMRNAPTLVGAVGGLSVIKFDERGLRVVAQQNMPRDGGANWLVVPDDADFPATRAIESGKRVVVTESADSGHLLDALPIVVDDEVIGAVTFAWDDPDLRDELLVGEVTDVITQALMRARHFEREQSISVTLQRGMLPKTLPRVDGAEVGACYVPGSDEADVGGDWFECLRLDDDQLLLAVGDVMGKGLPAASTMSEFRHALKALSVVDSSPRVLLRYLAAYHATRSGDKDQLLTLLIALVDPKTRSLTWSSAGHIPPLLLSASGAPSELLDSAQGLPLGLGDSWSEGKRELADGDALLLVSDGLVEDRRRSMERGLAQLLSVSSSLEVVSAAKVCDVVIAGMSDSASLADDITTLCLRVDGSITSSGWAYPAEARSVPLARARVEAELTRLGVDDPDVVQTVRLLSSELMTNAVRHSPESVTVCVDRVDHLIRVTVVDANSELRLEPRGIEVEAEHGRGLQLVEALATDWGVTPEGAGKQVWFELEMDRTASA